ncbi:type I-E CRISPR-associated protein Cse1/CasA [Microbacterium sp. No. 7]|uniref:type I-E CRISPR-associated protein Cse1/CasA n=1 Tax=Microbacterium sp. No. 7 TaxID=1714373 RepID=UPI0006ECDFDF|nr:type I-E CRISPR-associated protein Cse1/CasA [Microbacterium sp. No. 7]ALJ18535.1 hypothetical protein AOA12_00830 [Microbacterium sp. No. 7]
MLSTSSTASSSVEPSNLNLIDDPWISVRRLDGRTTEVSIREAFHRAHEIRDIVGELPTQTFSILRLLLAILYRAISDDVTPDSWSRLWKNGLPLYDIDDYLDAFHDRFWLLDGERPFFQVADLTIQNAKLLSEKKKDVSPLIFDVPSNNRHFTSRAGAGLSSLPLPEAARWLVNIQAFDISGIKSGVPGHFSFSNGRGSTMGIPAWSGLLGGVYARGRNLSDTLLLNLVGNKSGITRDLERDIPPWEDHEPDSAAERVNLAPNGPVRLYTWQSRRVRLFAEGNQVVGCLVANGDRLGAQNLQVHEPMTAWTYSPDQTKKAPGKQPTYMPRTHRRDRALWRGIGALLPGITQPFPKTSVPSNCIPGIMEWLSHLDNKDLLDGSPRIQLRAIGVAYGTQNSKVDELIDDTVLLPLALLRERNRSLAVQAEHAVSLADEGVSAVRRLAENLERAAGGTGEASRDRAVEAAYAALDRPYRSWLASLDDDVDPLDAIETWKHTARGILRRIGADILAQAGPAAWKGREVSRGGSTELVTAPRAEGWFLRALDKTFGKPTREDAAA